MRAQSVDANGARGLDRDDVPGLFVHRERDHDRRTLALALFGVQLALYVS